MERSSRSRSSSSDSAGNPFEDALTSQPPSPTSEALPRLPLTADPPPAGTELVAAPAPANTKPSVETFTPDSEWIANPLQKSPVPPIAVTTQEIVGGNGASPTATPTSPGKPPKLMNFLNQIKSDASSSFRQLKTIIHSHQPGGGSSGGGSSRETLGSNSSLGPISGSASAYSDLPTAVFGRSLSRVDLSPELGLPRVVVETVEHLTEHHLDLVGIFRIPGSHSEIRHIRQLYDQGKSVDFHNLDLCKTPHTISALLKLYFRELPEPLLTYELYDCFIAANGITVPEARLECIRKILDMLTPANLNLLVYLVRFLHLVSQHQQENKMTAANLAMVFAPNLLRSSDTDVALTMQDTPHALQILQTLIQEFDYFFKDFVPLPVETSPPPAEDTPEQVGPDTSASTSQSQPLPSASPAQHPQRRTKRADQRLVQNMTNHFRNLNAKLKHSMNANSNKTSPIEVVSPDVLNGNDSTTITTTAVTLTSAAILERPPKIGGPRENPFLNQQDVPMEAKEDCTSASRNSCE